MADVITTLNLRVQEKYDTKENWALNNNILLAGELGIESDTNKFKFGDGKTTWNSLPYANPTYEDFKDQIKTDVQTQVFMADIEDSSITDDAYLNGVSGISPKAGDIFIINRNFNGTKTQTPYTYFVSSDTNGWYAMAGKFDAKRVLIGHDITLAGNYESVGNIKLSI